MVLGDNRGIDSLFEQNSAPGDGRLDKYGGGPDPGSIAYCDNIDCSIQCFHFECVGLTDAPSGDWICTACKAATKS